jgi:hypothetical protein
VTIPHVVIYCGRADFVILQDGERVLRIKGGVLLAHPRARLLYVIRPGARKRLVRAVRGAGRAGRVGQMWAHRSGPPAAIALRLPQPRAQGRRLGSLATIGYTWYGARRPQGEPRYHPFDWPLPVVVDHGSVVVVKGVRWRLTARGIVG